MKSESQWGGICHRRRRREEGEWCWGVGIDILMQQLFRTTTKHVSSLGYHMNRHLPYSLSQTFLSGGFTPRVEFLPGYSNQGAMIPQKNAYFSL